MATVTSSLVCRSPQQAILKPSAMSRLWALTTGRIDAADPRGGNVGLTILDQTEGFQSQDQQQKFRRDISVRTHSSTILTN